MLRRRPSNASEKEQVQKKKVSWSFCCFCVFVCFGWRIFFNTVSRFKTPVVTAVTEIFHMHIFSIWTVSMFLPYSRSKGCLLRHLHTQLPLRATFQHRMSAECKNLWLADLQAHSVTAGRVQNKMCFSARSDYSPQLWLILCGQFSRRGKRAVSVSSQGLIIAADVGSSHSSLLWLLVPSFSAATLRTVLLRSAVAADLVFHPDRHFCGLLWTVSVHIALSLFPAAALVPFTLCYLHLNCFRHTKLNVEALESLEAPVRETTTWTFFLDLFWKICFVL